MIKFFREKENQIDVFRAQKEQLTTRTEETAHFDIATTKRTLEDQDQFITPGQTPKGDRKPFTNTQNNAGFTPAVPKKKVATKVAFGRSSSTLN